MCSPRHKKIFQWFHNGKKIENRCTSQSLRHIVMTLLSTNQDGIPDSMGMVGQGIPINIQLHRGAPLACSTQ